MRKILLTPQAPVPPPPPEEWLDLEAIAAVELSSEAEGFPIEAAFQCPPGQGWRAADPGEQTVRLLFDRPVHAGRVRLVFREEEQPRTQEFVLRWSDDGGRTFREVVRQQYTFTPPGTTVETEAYELDTYGLTVLELSIVPDIGGGSARASVAEFRVTE